MHVDRKRLIIGGLIVAVLAFWWFWRSTAATGTAGTVTATARANPSAADSKQRDAVAPVKIDALTSGREEPGTEARNPFRFSPKPTPSRPATPPAMSTPELSRPAVPAAPPPPPPIPLKFVGILERENGVKWAVLSDGKSPVMYGKDGDIIDGRYTIVKIGTESIEMTYTDGRGRQVIRLNGQ